MHDRAERPARQVSSKERAGSGLATAMTALGVAAGLFLAWRAASAIFLVFTGLLFGVFLDACTRGLGRLWGAPRGWRLATVAILLVLLVAAGTSAGGYTVAQQWRETFTTVQDQLRTLQGGLQAAAPQAGAQEGGEQKRQQGGPRGFLPDAGSLLESATTALGSVAGVLGNLVVIAFLGLYVAIDPPLYRRGALLLLPPHRRARIGAVLDESAQALRWWIQGQLVSMSIIATLTFVALTLVGMPGALALALVTGVLGFVPYVGSLIAGAVIVLVGLSQGGTMVLWAVGVYLLVQIVESYVVAPMVERWSVSLSPALVIGGLTVLGTLFGVWGFILAAPLLAVLRIVVLRLWVEDALEDRAGARASIERD